jgi:hypothetical protein
VPIISIALPFIPIHTCPHFSNLLYIHYMCYAPPMTINECMPSSETIVTSPSSISNSMETQPRVIGDIKRRDLMKKVFSVRKGLHHVQQCCSNSRSCDKALCKSTKRLISQYRSHACIKQKVKVNNNDGFNSRKNFSNGECHATCHVCLLWALVAGPTSASS